VSGDLKKGDSKLRLEPSIPPPRPLQPRGHACLWNLIRLWNDNCAVPSFSYEWCISRLLLTNFEGRGGVQCAPHISCPISDNVEEIRKSCPRIFFFSFLVVLVLCSNIHRLRSVHTMHAQYCLICIQGIFLDKYWAQQKMPQILSLFNKAPAITPLKNYHLHSSRISFRKLSSITLFFRKKRKISKYSPLGEFNTEIFQKSN